MECTCRLLNPDVEDIGNTNEMLTENFTKRGIPYEIQSRIVEFVGLERKYTKVLFGEIIRVIIDACRPGIIPTIARVKEVADCPIYDITSGIYRPVLSYAYARWLRHGTCASTVFIEELLQAGANPNLMYGDDSIYIQTHWPSSMSQVGVST